MPRYFNFYPKLLYTKENVSTLVTNVLTRVAKVKQLIDRASLYYEYELQEGDTPEIVASKYYGDPELHWVVLIFNDIYDPFYEWPMTYQQFLAYINDKYTARNFAVDTTLTGNLIFSNTSTTVTGTGTQFESQVIPGSKLYYMNSSNCFVATVATIQSDTQLTLTANSAYSSNTQILNDKVMTGIHHFEKVVEITDSASQTTSERVYEVDLKTYLSMPQEPFYQTNESGSFSISTKTYRRIVSDYDYENQLNESHRKIFLVKKELIPEVKKQFTNLMSR